MIPFDSWDGINDFTQCVEQATLEKQLGPASVVFSTYQAAISAILEVLGSRSQTIPVVMSVTSSPDTLSAVLRAGGEPVLIDIRPQTLQMDPGMLRTVLSEIGTAVVILGRPAGQYVDPELLELAGDLPTILDSRLPPGNIEVDSCCTFSVFDLGVLAGCGALVIHKYSQQVTELKLSRSGVLGLSASLNDVVAANVVKRLRSDPNLATRRSEQVIVANRYIELLKEKYVFPFDSSPDWPCFFVGVGDAARVSAHLHLRGIEVIQPILPLNLLPEVYMRMEETPCYPVAESLHKKLVALPTHPGVLGKETIVVERMNEVASEED
jgi:dTDP-4-amino-4,6-dideoxygalactose transaminase